MTTAPTNSGPGTIAAALAAATAQLRDTSPTPRLDAELLLTAVLGIARARLLADGALPLANAAARASFDALVARRAELEPVAYLTGEREFYGLAFFVDRRVLVPRPETELIVGLAIAHGRQIQRDRAAHQAAPATHPLTFAPLQIADIGTGSGCIAVALAANLPGALVYAVDRSVDALDVARRNIERHRLDGRIAPIHGDLLEPLTVPVDLIVSNPPYTVMAENDAGVNRHEPRLALDGGPDGLDLYRRLLAEAPGYLRSGGSILLEIGAQQGAAVAELARAALPNARVTIERDLAGWERAVIIDSV